MAETKKGLIIVHTGPGKGKTTAALGLALRAVGSGLKVLMVQFIKGPWRSGEHASVTRLGPDFKIISTGKGFVGILGDSLSFEEHMVAVEKGFTITKKEIASGAYHLLILDEIHNAIALGLIPVSFVLSFLDYAKDKV